VTDHRRKRAFASAAFVLLGITAVLTLGDPGSPLRDDARSERPRGSPAIRTGSPAVAERAGVTEARRSPLSVAPAPSTAPAIATRGEHEANSAPAVAPRDARAAATAARAFLAGYLPYSYGRAGTRRIHEASRSLARELAESPPRVPTSVAAARPRLLSVHTQATIARDQVQLLARVTDGWRRYDFPLSVRRIAGGWVATAVGG
jgi:hypothetical protein